MSQNKCASGSFPGKSFTDFPLTRSVEAIKSPNLLQMKELSSALKVNEFELDNSEEKN